MHMSQPNNFKLKKKILEKACVYSRNKKAMKEKKTCLNKVIQLWSICMTQRQNRREYGLCLKIRVQNFSLLPKLEL